MIVTFYSFKGGVGRSMAMVNVGEILADMGYRVIVSDWDLEAPGLERYLLPDDGADDSNRAEMERMLSQRGVIDLLLEYKESLAHPDADTAPTTSGEFATVGSVTLRRPSSVLLPVSDRPSRPGSLFLLTAGRRAGSAMHTYVEAARDFDWQEFYDRWAGDVYIDFLRTDLAGEGPARPGAADILLLDSRTGVTEHGGVCTHHLADVVVLLTAANELNLEGTKWMARALLDPQLAALRGGRPVRVIPVASRIEQVAQRDELVEFRRRFVTDFGDPLEASVGNAAEFALRSEIPYMPYYSFHERIVAREPKEKREEKLFQAYSALAEGLVQCGVKAGLLREPTSQGIVALPAAAPQPAESVAWDSAQFLRSLSEALHTRDKGRAAELCDVLEAHLAIADTVDVPWLRILGALRDARYVDLLQRATEAFIDAGISDPQVRRVHALSLLEQGHIASARSTLEALLAEAPSSPDAARVKDLLGRVYEESYLAATDPSSPRSRRNLEGAVNLYYEVFQFSSAAFASAGVATAALVLRARRDGVHLQAAPNPESIARAVLATLATSDALHHEGVNVEACLVIGDRETALLALGRVIGHGFVTLFDLHALHRRLRWVWQLDTATEPGASLLPPLRAAILARGGQVDVDVGHQRPHRRELEKHLDPDSVVTLRWYETGLERARIVARIETQTGQPVGTAFAIWGSALHRSLGTKTLLVTAGHILAPTTGRRLGVAPWEAAVVFEGNARRYGVEEIVFHSPVDDLDVTIATLDRHVDLPAVPVAKSLPSADGKEAVYLIGHAGGGALMLSMTDNTLLDVEDPVLHYRSPTEPGSSGSPIFNRNWELIGIHHAASPTMRRLHGKQGVYAANEGISMIAIIHALRRALTK